MLKKLFRLAGTDGKKLVTPYIQNGTMSEEKKEKDEGLNIKVLFALGYQWIKLDDVITWSKAMELHEVTREFVKLKNQKPNS